MSILGQQSVLSVLKGNWGKWSKTIGRHAQTISEYLRIQKFKVARRTADDCRASAQAKVIFDVKADPQAGVRHITSSIKKCSNRKL